MPLPRPVRLCAFALAAAAGPALAGPPDPPRSAPPTDPDRPRATLAERAEPGPVQALLGGLALFAADRLFSEPDVARAEGWTGAPGPSVGLNF